mmetsp:Transcript_38944/g.110273  ORF Transcript_38944/g.110273 Transcript_38944/m.110273 type:complete len:187 (+) Transcript_38944:443-1003(+)
MEAPPAPHRTLYQLPSAIQREFDAHKLTQSLPHGIFEGPKKGSRCESPDSRDVSRKNFADVGGSTRSAVSTSLPAIHSPSPPLAGLPKGISFGVGTAPPDLGRMVSSNSRVVGESVMWNSNALQSLRSGTAQQKASSKSSLKSASSMKVCSLDPHCKQETVYCLQCSSLAADHPVCLRPSSYVQPM